MFRMTLSVLFTLVAIPTYANDMLEPCINGNVSASGNLPSQEMEDRIMEYLSWQSGEPDYLFRITSQDIFSSHFE
jgi:hypothetical protein